MVKTSKPKCFFHKMNLTDSGGINRVLHISPLHSISVIAPDGMRVSKTVSNLMDSGENMYLLAQKVPLHILLEHMFIKYYVRKGPLWLLTVHSNGSTDNFVSIFPPGHLLLSLEKDVYEKMGICGGLCIKKVENDNKYDLTIELTSPLCEPTKNGYEKLLAVFKKSNLFFDVILTWSPADSSICRTSIQEYFNFKGLQCKICDIHHMSSIKYSVPVPKINYSQASGDIAFCDKEDLLQWIGAQICGIQCDDKEEETLNDIMLPHPSTTSPCLYMDQWKGMFSPELISKLAKKASEMIFPKSNISFIALMAHGYQDSWSGPNFHEFTNSDFKALCVVIFPGKNCWVFKM